MVMDDEQVVSEFSDEPNVEKTEVVAEPAFEESAVSNETAQDVAGSTDTAPEVAPE